VNILALTDFYPPVIGGLERHVETLSRELVGRGHSASVAALRHPAAPPFEVADGVRVHRIPTAWSRHLARFYEDETRPFHPTVPDPGVMRALGHIVREERPDVVHARGWILYSYLPMARRLGIPVVVTLQDYGLVCAKRTLLHEGRVCTGPQWLKCVKCGSEPYGVTKSVALTTGLKAMGRFHGAVDTYVAISNSVAIASRPGTAGRPTIVIPSFIPDDVVREGDAVPRPAFLPEEDGFLLYVGSLGAHKGVDVLLRSYVTLDNRPPLVLIGASHSAGTRSLPRGVLLVQDVAHPQVMASWARSSMGLVPSLWPEPFGQVAVEAMAVGRPVVASDIGGLRDVVVNGETGLLVPPGDELALAAAIRQLLDNPYERQQMGAAGQTRAKRFMVSSVADRIESLYQDLCEG
jgi:glycosyltransferase involved in cell wall biosynthesis